MYLAARLHDLKLTHQFADLVVFLPQKLCDSQRQNTLVGIVNETERQRRRFVHGLAAIHLRNFEAAEFDHGLPALVPAVLEPPPGPGPLAAVSNLCQHLSDGFLACHFEGDAAVVASQQQLLEAEDGRQMPQSSQMNLVCKEAAKQGECRFLVDLCT